MAIAAMGVLHQCPFNIPIFSRCDFSAVLVVQWMTYEYKAEILIGNGQSQPRVGDVAIHYVEGPSIEVTLAVQCWETAILDSSTRMGPRMSAHVPQIHWHQTMAVGRDKEAWG